MNIKASSDATKLIKIKVDMYLNILGKITEENCQSTANDK